MAQQPDVAVIGGGIIGLTLAYFLAKDGRTVEVLDRADLGREASWAGAGIIPPGNPDRAATPADRLRALGSVRFPELAAELRDRTGIDNGYRVCGGIEFLYPEDEYVFPLWKAEGIAFERLTPAALKADEPHLAATSGEPYLLPGCAQVRNPWHMRALVAACESLGVRLRTHEPVRHLETSDNRVLRANVGSGRILEAGAFLIAAGAWSEGLLRELGQRPNVHPVRGQIALFHPPCPVVNRVLMFGKRYFVPRGDGRILIGSTEEPEAGFEKVNTPEAMAKLTAFAVRTVPLLAEAPVETCWAGLRPGSPDGLPFLGAVPGYDNVFVATGHYRAGVQLSVGTGQVIAELLQGKPLSVPLDDFRIDREPHTHLRPAFRS